MKEYEYHFVMFPSDETVDIPDEAVGITCDSFGDNGTVRYLTPIEDDEGQ